MYNQIAQPGHRTRPTIGGRLYADHEPDECEARNHAGIRVAGPQSSHEGIGQVHRYVPLLSVTDLEQPGLRQLLEHAMTVWGKRNAAPRGS